MPPRIILCTAGSLGDLHPFIALGVALKARGFQAEIATSVEYGAKVEAEGLVFHRVGPGVAQLSADLGMDLAEITRAIARSDRFLFEKVMLPYLETWTREVEVVARGSSAVVGATFAAGAAMAAEMAGVPYVSAALQPTVVFSAYDPPFLPRAPWLAPATSGARLWLNRATIGLARASTDPWTKPINRVRASLGLPARKANLFFDGAANADLALGLYSPLLSPVQPDAPAGFAVTGYAAYDSEAGGPVVMPRELDRFLDAGSAPIVFTLGSAAVLIPGDFYVESLKAARRMGRRAVLLVGPEGDPGVADGPDAIALPYAPYSKLFPRAAAIVHQGGVGTTQQALRAGRPQMVVPFLGDQFDNGARIVRLGCGATLSRRAYRAGRVATVLDRMLADPTLVGTATRLGVVASREDGAAVAAERIVQMFSLSRRERA
ncbi:glycosyltransferase [Brevundimonas sp.]|uniref:nucleotide disphospho-sugar-binding domain-containing protein n=1 Tax=Brevundimonas sp. TaxID=1871086 RepID=UPI002612354B|nr:glycosyltransferase [Brevundimonas sp.]